MFYVENNCYELILFIQSKVISFCVKLQMWWKFYGMLCMVILGSGNYVMIFGVLYPWYVIYTCSIAIILV